MLKITVVACGNKMPSWIIDGTIEFMKRLQEFSHFQLIEIPLEKRSKSSHLARLLEKEAILIQAAIPQNSYIIALDKDGKTFSSEKLALKIEQLQHHANHLCILIGGPEGFISSTLKKANECWSLSSLTLPHPLVRIILMEAIYRALSILQHHPYHK